MITTVFVWLYELAAGIGRREIESKQAYASGIKLFKMKKDTNFQLDDSIVIDYTPVHTSPEISPPCSSGTD